MMDHWSRYAVDPETGCWNWTGPLDRGGYGSAKISGHYRTHRAFYERYVGSIPAGLQIDHLCRNRACVNPAHMEPVTQRENILRGESPSAHAARATHCRYGHPLTGDNLVKSHSWRSCRICHNRRCREHRGRKKEAQRG
jgi:HNH endonuclease